MASNLEYLAQLRRATNQVVTLRPFDTVLKVQCDDDKAAILIETFRYKETAREIRFTERGTKLISFAKCTDQLPTYGRWAVAGEMILWDDEFVPFIHVKFGKSVSPREHAEQVAWERQCYRPGTSRNPLDNYERVLAGPTTDAMERYW